MMGFTWKRWRFVVDLVTDKPYVIVHYHDGSYAARHNDGFTYKNGTLIASCSDLEDALLAIKSEMGGHKYALRDWRDD